MRVIKVKGFDRWARRERIGDRVLRIAVREMNDGLVDAYLGGGVCKKRISMSSCGKRGGGRVIVAFKNNKHTFFMFGYLKNELSNIDQAELKALKQYALREKFKVSQSVFAALLNVSPSTVQKWEQGQKEPSSIANRLLQVVENYGLGVLISKEQKASR